MTEPADIQAQLEKGALQWREGLYEASLATFADLARACPRVPAVLDAHVQALLGLGQVGAAQQAIDYALALRPRPPTAVLLAALDAADRSIAASRRLLEPLLAEIPDFELARIAWWQLLREPPPGRTFPATALEQAMVESTEWIEEHGAAPWTAFACQVLDQALAAATAPGLVVECGVFHGRSLRQLALASGAECHGFDSFEGLPEAWLDHPRGAYSTRGSRPAMPDNVTLWPGWFEDTLPGFARERSDQRIALLHIDCDLYSSTVCVLEALHPLIDADTVLVFDDLCGLPGWQQHEYRALREWCDRESRHVEVLAATRVGREVALKALPRR